MYDNASECSMFVERRFVHRSDIIFFTIIELLPVLLLVHKYVQTMQDGYSIESDAG